MRSSHPRLPLLRPTDLPDTARKPEFEPKLPVAAKHIRLPSAKWVERVVATLGIRFKRLTGADERRIIHFRMATIAGCGHR
jgi:hypothetical protein